MKLIHSFLFVILSIVIVNAQDRYLKGTIVDALTQETLIGANVSYVGGNTITDTEGKYIIRTEAKELKVTVSYIGYILHKYLSIDLMTAVNYLSCLLHPLF